MTKEQRFEFTYKLTNGTVKKCYPKSEEQKARNIEICAAKGYKVVSIKKLYPFSTIKNQHNFELISNICFNTMHDMESGEISFDSAEYDRLSDLKEKAERFFELPLPVAWLPYEVWRDANELANMAILHRQEACIAAGRPELVTYC